MLSPFDSIYPFPIYLVVTCRESWFISGTEIGVDLQHKLWWFGCDIELYPWPHFGIGTRRVWSPFRFCFDIGLCLWLHYGIGTRSAWLHSNGINVHDHQLTHQFFCEHFSDTLGDVVASFPFGEADSSVTAAIQKVLSCCNKTGNEFIWEARFVPYFCVGFLLLAAIAVGEYLLSSWIAALSNFSYRLQIVVVW